MEFIQIEVKERQELGTAAVRRMRIAGAVPAVLYGLKRRNLALSVPGDELARFLSSGSHLVELRMGGDTRDAILREVQQDPITDQILHVDFVRVDKGVVIEDQVPVVYKGTAPGTREGGVFQSIQDVLNVSARPRDIPRQILIDVSALNVGDAILAKDVEFPEGVTYLGEPDDMIAHVVLMRGIEDDEEGIEDAPAEPEVIGQDEEADGDKD